jgi:hypothetical protein
VKKSTRETANEADMEVLARSASAHKAHGEIQTGKWYPDPKLFDALADLDRSAALWAKRAEAYSAPPIGAIP